MVYEIKGRNITLKGNPTALEYDILCGNDEWHIRETPYVILTGEEKITFPKPTTEEKKVTGTTEEIIATYKFDNDITITTRASIEISSDDVLFSLSVVGDSCGQIEKISFPAPFEFGKSDDTDTDLNEKNLPNMYTVLSRKQGAIIPIGTEIGLIDGGRIFSEDAYMPIFGQVSYNTGYLAIYDTPYDALYEIRYSGGDKIAPIFIPSLGTVRYTRQMRYHFMQNCDYNDFATYYRSYVKERGKLVTLREKIQKNAHVEELIGCPIIHSGIAKHVSPDSSYYNKEDLSANDSYVTFKQRADQIKELYKKGLRKAYTHFDGWGNHGYDNLHPEPFPPHEAAGGFDGMKELADTVNGCGYIFGIHDQYRDYYYDAPNFSFDNAVTNIDGSHPFCSIWLGGKHTFLCSSKAPEYVRHNYKIFKDNGIDIRAAYLDVFSIVRMDECFNPEHPVTRKECAENRQECFDYLSANGIIPSSEEVLDCLIPGLVLCHHAPFFTTFEGKQVGIPIPLLNLVYHDCIIIPWIERKGAMTCTGLPNDISANDYARLCANPIYLSITADEKEIENAVNVCSVAERLALEPMIKHEFLTKDRRTQRTTFGNGETVEVCLD